MIPLLATSLPDHPSLVDSLRYHTFGFTLVMLILGALWLLVRGIGWVFRKSEAVPLRPHKEPAAATAAAAPAAAAAATETSSAIPADILVVIAAATHAVLGVPHQIVAIREQTATASTELHLLAWSAEGRRQIFASHRLR